jgi:hypothetical protein
MAHLSDPNQAIHTRATLSSEILVVGLVLIIGVGVTGPA